MEQTTTTTEAEQEPAPEEPTTTTEDVVAGVEVARELPRTGDAVETGTLLVLAGLALLLGGLALGFADRSTGADRRI